MQYGVVKHVHLSMVIQRFATSSTKQNMNTMARQLEQHVAFVVAQTFRWCNRRQVRQYRWHQLQLKLLHLHNART